MQHEGGRRREADRDIDPGDEGPGDDEVLLARRVGASADDDAASGPSLTAAELDALFERPARPRVRIGIGAGIVLALVALAVGLVIAALQPSPATVVGEGVPSTDAGDALPGDALPGDAPSPTSPVGDTVGDAADGVAGAGGGAEGGDAEAATLVHVVGAVVEPGVVALTGGARVIDAITAAGGFTDEADRAAVNLARAVVDGEQVYVPKVGETPPAPPPGVGADGGAGGAGAGGSASTDAAGAGGGLVNLNTAGQAELETLPRIGPSLAQRIIEYREANGGFASVDELMNVSGIGDATYQAIAPLVTV